MSFRRWGVRSGFSRRGVSRRASRPTETGSPMASRNSAAAESTWRQPPADPPRPSPRLLSGSGARLVTRRPLSAVLGQRHRDAPPENNVDWYVAAIPGGSPVPNGGAQRAAARGIPGVSGTAVSRRLGGRGKPHPLSWQRRRLLEHVAGGHLSRDLAASARPPQRATFGTTDEAAASVDLGRTDGVHQPNDGGGHLEPADRRRSRQSSEGPLTRVTQDAADDYDPTLSDDGATLVFRSRRAGRFGVF